MESEAGGERFPFVSVPLFEVVAAQVRKYTGVENVYWGPVVSRENYLNWIDYSVANQDWLTASRLAYLSKTGETWEEAGFDNDTIPEFIFDIDEDANPIKPTNSDGPWEPLWQMSPPPFKSGVVNFNLHYNPYIPLIEKATDELRHGLLGVGDFSLNGGMGVSVDDHEAFHENLVQSDRGEGYKSYTHPRTLFVEPIYEDLYRPSDSPIVGHVFSLMTWDKYLIDLLPEGVKDITAVVRNTCGQSFTYDLDGNTVSSKNVCNLIHCWKFDLTILSYLSFRHSIEEKGISMTHSMIVLRSLLPSTGTRTRMKKWC
jgi:hypothetical protein